MEKYQPSEIEPKWQGVWEKERIYQPDLDTARRPFYNLMMFPYPSAEGLHVGSVFTFTGVDIYGRFKRMQGYDVFEPIGLDGFGINSENYAIKIGRHPKEQAKLSEKNFYRQLHVIGNSFDWSRTVETYDPRYYKWTQWIFTQLFKKGLAYRKKSPVNFCPKDKTVLADEQVIDGKCERCGSVVEKRDLEQWFFKITEYADRLLAGLDRIDWTEKVKIAQRNWIGKSQGVNLRFKVKDLDIYFEMFDSVPQTFMAQTFTVIAPEHPKVYELVKGTEHEKPVMEFVERIKKKKANKKFNIEKETEGIFTGRYIDYKAAKRLIPIWVASFVIAEYGTGVVNGSAHDERDFAFAKKYNLPLHPVMFPPDPKEAEKVKNLEYCYHHATEGILHEPQQFKGRRWGEVREDIINYIERNGWGKRSSQYHLRDWLISRQRYWGPPIPMVYCEKCDWQPVPEKDLPILLPDVKDWKPKGTGVSPLASVGSFVNTTCPNCGGKARRETDVSDTFLDSSWYFFRYLGTDRDDVPFPSKRFVNSKSEGNWKLEIGNFARRARWLPVSSYIGGAEHAVLHLLYTRFLTMVFHDSNLTDFDEPFPKFRTNGLLIKEGAKMSKSRGNIVEPDPYIKKYGADTLRTYLMFLGPFSQGGDFYDSSIGGVHRFLGRVYNLVSRFNKQTKKVSAKQNSANQSDQNKIVEAKLHETIKKISEDMEALRFNTSVAALMELLNTFQAYQSSVRVKHLQQFLLMLAPFAPHLSEELWQQLRILTHKDNQYVSIHVQGWPTYDPKMLEKEEVTVVVQVNGKVRDTIRSKKSEVRSQKSIEAKARESKKVKKHLEGKSVQRVIYVEGKILNFVVG